MHFLSKSKKRITYRLVILWNSVEWKSVHKQKSSEKVIWKIAFTLLLLSICDFHKVENFHKSIPKSADILLFYFYIYIYIFFFYMWHGTFDIWHITHDTLREVISKKKVASFWTFSKRGGGSNPDPKVLG